jgi:hypothetical protein
MNDFILIPNKFLDSGFDAHTISVYTRFLMRSSVNKSENQAETCRVLQMTFEELKDCRDLLEFCNIITITRENNSNTIGSFSLVILNDVHKWNLDHEWRDAKKFGEYLRKQESVKSNLA